MSISQFILEPLEHHNGTAEIDSDKKDVDKDAGILLDGVGDVMLLHTHREVLQGRPK